MSLRHFKLFEAAPGHQPMLTPTERMQIIQTSSFASRTGASGLESLGGYDVGIYCISILARKGFSLAVLGTSGGLP